MRLLAASLFGLVGVAASVAPAAACPMTAATILDDFNVVIYNDATTSSAIEGAAVIGDNFSGPTVYSDPAAKQPDGFGALTVYGSSKGTSINVDDGGSAYVAGTRHASIAFTGNGGYAAAPPKTIGDFKTPLNALSQSLSMLAATAANPTSGNNEVFSALAGSDGIAVFDLTAAALAAIPSFSVALNGASTVVFNVDGASVTDAAKDLSGASGASKIIWNFYDATGNVTLNSLIGGTVLATGATVINGGQIDGGLVAKNWNGNGAVQDRQFTGQLPADPGAELNVIAVPVPEPASVALLGVGLLGLGAFRRRLG